MAQYQLPYSQIYPCIALATHGRIGKMWVHKEYKKYKVVAKYYYPEQPRTGRQQGWKSVFYDAVYNWRGFDDLTKGYYNKRAKPIGDYGYHRYLSLYLKANYPMIIYWGPLKQSASQSVAIPDYIASPYFTRGLNIQPITWNGWNEAKETFTFTSFDADYDTGVIAVAAGAASRFWLGMKVCIIQETGGIKYGIITKIADTALTVYFGTDYTLNDEAITAPLVSLMKAPQGFPLAPAKWTVETRDTGKRTETGPTLGTWYNTGTITINIPIGSWDVSWQANIGYNDNTGNVWMESEGEATLSTANNSESDSDFTTYVKSRFERGAGIVSKIEWNVAVGRHKPINITTEDIYYFNVRLTEGGGTITIQGSESPTIIRARCSYL